MSKSTIKDFERRVADIPVDLCAPFNQEARQLETGLLMIHRMAALCAREEQDLSEVAAMWDCMVKVCDEFAKRLNALKQKHPYCGAEVYYDRVLDLRNKCQRLQQMHS